MQQRIDGEETIQKITEIQEVISTDDREEEGQSSKQNIITEQEAIEIAKKAVETVNEMELDEGDKRYVYEFELNTSKGESEVKVDTVTGKVLKK